MSKISLGMSQTKCCLTIIVLLLLSAKMVAQIPNSGFENWTTVGGYENPTGWASSNYFSTGSFYAVTKSTDHYPVTVGTYSVRIENNISLLSNNSGYGTLMTEPFAGHPKPSFPITGHPTSLTGYYKFAPQNGDTMSIKINLFNAGTIVSENYFTTTTGSVSSWISFNIPISNYTSADSGSILITPWYPGGSSSKPHGNSVLYIDNLSFDTLVTSVSKDQTFGIPVKYELNQNYPNPWNPTTTINYSIPKEGNIKLTIYNTIGSKLATIVNENKQAGNYSVQFNASDLPSGVYFYRIQAGSFVETKKMILLK